jgi:hypothetical protein
MAQIAQLLRPLIAAEQNPTLAQARTIFWLTTSA